MENETIDLLTLRQYVTGDLDAKTASEITAALETDADLTVRLDIVRRGVEAEVLVTTDVLLTGIPLTE